MKELVCNIAVKNLIENEDMKNFLRLVEVYRDSEEKDRRSAEALGIMIDLLRQIDIFAHNYGDEELLKFIRKEVVPQVWKMRIRAAVESAAKRLADKKKKKE